MKILTERWKISHLPVMGCRGVTSNAGTNSSHKEYILPLRSPSRLHQRQFAQQKGVVECDLLQVVVASACPAVAGLHVGHQQQRVAVHLKRAQFGYILGRLPEHDLAVM